MAWRLAVIAAMGWMGLWAAMPARATTVEQITFSQLCQDAELIFEGRVVSTHVLRRPDSERLYTEVTFQVLDLVKGTWPTKTIRLSFTGGTLNGVTLALSDMRLPELGETGIYFVESTSRQQIHPLLGWSQGHFLVTDEAEGGGYRRVLTSDHKPVAAVRTGGPLRTGITTGAGMAVGLETGASVLEALELDEFKRQIRGQISPTSPAGKP